MGRHLKERGREKNKQTVAKTQSECGGGRGMKSWGQEMEGGRQASRAQGEGAPLLRDKQRRG